MNIYWLGFSITDNALMLAVLIAVGLGIYAMIRVHDAVQEADWRDRLNQQDEKSRKRK